MDRAPQNLCHALDNYYGIILDGDRVEHASVQRLHEPQPANLLSDRPLLASHMVRMLLRDLEQFLGSLPIAWWSPLDESSARFVMRLTSLALLLVTSSTDPTCVDDLVPLFHQSLATRPQFLPGFTATLFQLLRTNLESIVDYRKSLCISYYISPDVCV